MSRLLGALILLASGCNSGKFSESEIGIDTFHGLVEDASWTWRDDTLVSQYEAPEDEGEEPAIAEEPVAEELLKGRLVGDTIDIRRGARWPDGAPAASIQFDTGAGLALVSWDIGDMTGDTWLPMVYSDSTWEDTVESGGWSCSLSRAGEVQTWYAIFEDTLQIACSGGDGPSAIWTFARDRGLVRLDTPDGEILLDLVGGW